MQMYSDFFKTLHDETGPTGHLGRGTHYSVLRAVVFHDPMRKPLPEGQFADFAVIWDEDHDTRVMEPIEEIYRRGLLSSFLMFGERKGSFTAILSSKIPLAINPAFLLSVNELQLSVRSSNCLKYVDIYYIGDLVQKTEDELLRAPPLGRKSLNEIKEVLAQMGLHLGMEVPGWSLAVARVAFLETEIKAICQSLDDPWPTEIVALESAKNPIIDAEDEKVSLYLKNLDMLWQLGTVERQPQKPTSLELGVAPPVAGFKVGDLQPPSRRSLLPTRA
jgi:hypothetical protein